MNQKMTLKQRMLNFMQGRYGVDQLSGFLIWTAVIIAVITMFVRIPALQIVTWVMIIYAYIRIFSKQINKRYAQNQKFLNWRYGLAVKKQKTKVHMEQRKVYHFYKCPQCGQKVRVPKGRGKICITCPKCKMEFIRRS